jgi:membrane protease YdiL (CAAX protease family)
LLLAYSALGAAAAFEAMVRGSGGSAEGRTDHSRVGLVVGLALAAVGYPLGRVVLGDHPTGPPPDALWIETLSLAGAVAPAEELVWGDLVEPAAGIVATSILFAAKHVAIDRRWGRFLGLAMFGVGLGLLRRRSRKLAVLVHVGCNAAAVALGHVTGKDQF